MKKIIIIIVTIMVAATVNAQTIKERGMGLWQDTTVAQNFIIAADHVAYLQNGGIFPGFNANLCYGKTQAARNAVWAQYLQNIKIADASMAGRSLASLATNLLAIDTDPRVAGALSKMFHVGYINNATALAILASDMITVDYMPAFVPGGNDSILMDTYEYQMIRGQKNVDQYVAGGWIKRPRHFLPAAGEFEKCLFLNIPGFEPIPIRSTFCGNNIASRDIVKFIKKKQSAIVITSVPTEVKTTCKTSVPTTVQTTCKSVVPTEVKTTCKTSAPTSVITTVKNGTTSGSNTIATQVVSNVLLEDGAQY